VCVRVVSGEELIKVASKDVDFLGFCPVNGVNSDGVFEPEESMDVA
jgi:hypothetical protein